MPPQNPQIAPRRGEIWRVRLDPSVGAELQKTRPCIVMNKVDAGRLPLRVLVPLSGWQPTFNGYPWCVQVVPDTINNLSKLSAADTFQIKSLSLDRFSQKLGDASPEVLEEIALAIAHVVGYVTSDGSADE